MIAPIELNPKISLDVLILCRNEAPFLRTLGRSLESLFLPEGLEIRFKFFDNCSTDGSQQIINKFSISHKTLFTQKVNIGGFGNFKFAYTKIDADYFMFMDAHDYLTSMYFHDFYSSVLSLPNKKFAHIGRIITLAESSNMFFPAEIQNKMEFSRNNNYRAFQLVLFLFHNSIYHAIFPTKFCDIQNLIRSKSFIVDHLITHTGLAQCNIKYLENSFYVRRYREIVGPDFAHWVDNEIQTRSQRGLGDISNEINNTNIAIEISSLMQIKNPFYNKMLVYLLKGKYKTSRLPTFAYRIIRFLHNNLLPINRVFTSPGDIPDDIYIEVINMNK